MKKQTLPLARIKDTILLNKQAIVIAVSGGSDSIALLHILSSLYPKNQRIAVYINHGLRPQETAAEELLVKTLANACGAAFVSLTVDVAAEQRGKKSSLEEAARYLRYQALEKVRKQYNAQCIAVGHTSDDQAEEILLRLIRGSGSAGLSGMPIHNGFIARPLLAESKASLRDYLRKEEIAYCEDSSNSDLRFLRNQIRHDLLPHLEQQYNKSMRTTLLQTAAILAEEHQLLDKLTDTLFQKICHLDNGRLLLDSTAIIKEPIALQRRIFEKISWQMSAKPSFKQIASLLGLAHAKRGAEIHLSKGLRAIKQEQDILFHYPVQKPGYRGPGVPDKTFTALAIPTPGTYCIPELGYQLILKKITATEALQQQDNCQILDAAQISFPLTLRHHHAGETFHPLGSPGTKKISRFLTDQKIPALDKENFPVLLTGKAILTVLGLRIDNNYRTHATTSTYLELHWQKTK